MAGPVQASGTASPSGAAPGALVVNGVVNGPDGSPRRSAGLRSLKKERTRLAIADAALELFIEKGYEATTVDEIAERAEISKATFFRYFAAKGEVIFLWNEQNYHGLADTIVDRPSDEDDLTALRQALGGWIATLDTTRMVRQGLAVSTSPLLRGISYDLSAAWQDIVAGALARRHGLEAPDQRCRLVASIAFAVFSNAFNTWVGEERSVASAGTRAYYESAVEHAFDLLDGISQAPSASG
jgi:AcrR family transcriptional regulator